MQKNDEYRTGFGIDALIGAFGNSLGEPLARINHDDAVQSIGAWSRLVIVTLSVIAVGYIWSQLTWLWLYGVSVDTDGERSIATVGRSAQPLGSNDVSVLTRIDPFFARAVQVASSQSNTNIDAPETNLDLELFGVRAGDPDVLSTAIIKTPEKGQQTFRVGDTIMAGVELSAVLPDRVVLSRSGVKESLLLDPEKTGLRATTSSTVTPASSSVAELGGLSIASLFSQMSLEPRVVSGRIDGFYIGSLGNSMSADSGGLEAGDLITAVNGVRLVSVERITDLIEELGTATQASLEIQRDGAPRSLTLNLAGVTP